MPATAIGAVFARWSCSSRAAARICAITAASAASGRGGAIAIPSCFAKELARLHREHGVKVINFADENPTVSKKAWRVFLEALIAENVDLILVGSTRADDIVRDADILHLYKKAGWARFLLGMESTDEKTLQLIRKGAATTTDREAIRLMRRHGILSMATWVVGLRGGDRPRSLARIAAAAVLRSRPDPDAVCHAASLDALFQTRRRSTRDPDRPPPLGLQASGACDALHAALARAVVVQVHRDGFAGPPESSFCACCSILTAAFGRRCAGTQKWGAGSGLMKSAASCAIAVRATARPSRSFGDRHRKRRKNRCPRHGPNASSELKKRPEAVRRSKKESRRFRCGLLVDRSFEVGSTSADPLRSRRLRRPDRRRCRRSDRCCSTRRHNSRGVRCSVPAARNCRNPRQ